MLPHFETSPDVADALQNEKPVVALESTLITHGLPYPTNLETAIACEQIAREQGVTPATIAIMNGKIKIGLTQADLETLVQDKTAVKASKRDIPFILSQKLNAGTTVAATLYCAHRAGIRLFGTGGIGGVHRGTALDISADLIELAQTPVAVVCAGAKAILDLPKTIEYLETHSVPVIGYKTNTLPAFYSAESDIKLTMNCDNIQDIAHIIKTHWELKIPSGILIANPVPKDVEIPNKQIEPVIANALQEADNRGITGKAITPFLLKELVTATQGASLKTNIALIKHNIQVASELALQS